MEINRRREVLYTHAVAHMACEAMVRNFTDPVEEGDRRMLRVARRGIRRESLDGYALLPREDIPPVWVSPNSFGML